MRLSIRYLIGCCLAAALLAACAANATPPAGNALTSSFAHRRSGTSSYRVLFEFRRLHGAHPFASLVNVGGTLYGTTAYGGASKQGTIYALTPSGVETVLHSFAGGSDGAQPIAHLTEVNGTLYGTTYLGGSNGSGTVFGVSTSGAEKVLYSFTGGADGGFPDGGLLNVKGTLYGTTEFGGDLHCKGAEPGCGTAYSIGTSGSEHVLHRFTKGADGAFPTGDLLNVSGALYGTTEFGGSKRKGACCGTVYSVTTAGAETIVHAFSGGPDGTAPGVGLIGASGKLYGITRYGGTGCGGGSYYGDGCGLVYSLSTTGTEKVLHRFTGSQSDGASPDGPLRNVNGTLYGTTALGGADCQDFCGDGTVYRVSMSGVEKVLHFFSASDGQTPSGGVIDVDGLLYGTTLDGGRGCPRRDLGGCGTVFTLSP